MPRRAVSPRRPCQVRVSEKLGYVNGIEGKNLQPEGGVGAVGLVNRARYEPARQAVNSRQSTFPD
jgi:hypothetical protein